MKTKVNPKSETRNPKLETSRLTGARTFLSACGAGGGGRADRNVRAPWLAAALLLLTTPVLAPAQTGIPAAVNYQGTLTDNLGNPVTNGYYQVQFRIWDSPALTGAGDYVWGRSYPLYVAVGGLFNILLNDDGGLVTTPGTPAATSLLSAFAGPSRYLGLTITANPQGAIASPIEISPRQQLVSAPYAMQAQNATAAVSAGFATNAASLVNETKGQVVSVTGTNVVVNGSISGYGTFPLGGIIMWSGATVPSGWALCDGNNNTPDLRGRFVLGSGTGSGLTARSVGQAGGEENHALTTSEMPSHTHGVTDPGHGHNFTFYDSDGVGWNGGAFQLTDRTPRGTGAAELLTAITGISIQSNGSNTAHNTMPPFYVLAYIMRVQ